MEVVCFEPAPLMANRILENAALNGVSLSLCSFALGDSAGKAWLEVTPGNMGMSHIANGRSKETAVLCAVDSGDSLISRGLLNQPTVMKIDVEGHEQVALEGMRGVIKNPALRAIVFEYYHDIEQHPANPIHSMLVSAGFTLQKLVRQEPTSHPLDNYLAAR
jgi:FkbM family methyltransferase